MSIVTVNVDVGSPGNVRDLLDVETKFHKAVSEAFGTMLPTRSDDNTASHWQKRQLQAEVTDDYRRAAVVRAVTESARGRGLEVSVDAGYVVNCRPQPSVRAAADFVH
jgi:hypothetical protein